MSKVKDIKFESKCEQFWVLDNKDSYAVMQNGLTHSVSDSFYRHDPDGLSIAIARCKYLAKAKGDTE